MSPRRTQSPPTPPRRIAPKPRAPITPLDLPKGTQTVVVFGGTFDPPHRYHIEGPRRAVRASIAHAGTLILFIPAAQSPHKATGPIASAVDRMRMLELALRGRKDALIWRDEIDRSEQARARGHREPSYTVHTLRRLRQILPRNVRLRLLIGADQAAKFHAWKRPREIMRLAEPLVMLRPPIDTPAKLQAALRAARKGIRKPSNSNRRVWTERDIAVWLSRVARVQVAPPSSTSVRNALRARSGTSAIHDLDPRVLAYIHEHRLYQ